MSSASRREAHDVTGERQARPHASQPAAGARSSTGEWLLVAALSRASWRERCASGALATDSPFRHAAYFSKDVLLLACLALPVIRGPSCRRGSLASLCRASSWPSSAASSAALRASVRWERFDHSFHNSVARGCHAARTAAAGRRAAAGDFCGGRAGDGQRRLGSAAILQPQTSALNRYAAEINSFPRPPTASEYGPPAPSPTSRGTRSLRVLAVSISLIVLAAGAAHAPGSSDTRRWRRGSSAPRPLFPGPPCSASRPCCWRGPCSAAAKRARCGPLRQSLPWEAPCWGSFGSLSGLTEGIGFRGADVIPFPGNGPGAIDDAVCGDS